MWVLLPVAGLSINVFLLIGAGTVVGFLSGLLGVGGGFLLTPILMMIGIPPTVAAASDSCQIVAASSSGVAAHFRLGNVDFKLGGVLLLGGLAGAAIGVELIKILRAMGNADFLITVTYIVVLGGVGGSMFVASLKNLRRGPMAARSHRPRPAQSILQRLPFQMRFSRANVQHSVVVPFVLCAIVGVLAAIMGVGGGFMMVPMMVYLLRVSPHVAVGTDLFQILFTCAGVTYLQATTNHTVDLPLALLLAVGSTVGAQIGARVSRLLRGDQLLIILASLALLVVGRMIASITIRPLILLSPVGGHSDSAETDRRKEEPPARNPISARPSPSGLFVPVAVVRDIGIRMPIPVRVTPDAIEMNAFYSGARVVVEGVAAPGNDVAIRVTGDEREEVFNQKGRVGPIWINTGRIKISGAPSLFLCFAVKPLDGLLARSLIEDYQLDPAAIRRQMRVDPADADVDGVRGDYLAMKTRDGVYRVSSEAVQMAPPQQAGTPYRVEFDWPRKGAPGRYTVRVHEFRYNEIQHVFALPLDVVEVGFPAWIAAFAKDRASLYGAACVLIAVLAGFGIDFLATVLFGRRRAAAH